MVNIILASKSKIRAKILNNNGINCTVVPSNVDENVDIGVLSDFIPYKVGIRLKNIIQFSLRVDGRDPTLK